MSDHPNLQLMQRTLDAFRAADLDALSTLFSPDVAWHVPGRNPVARTYRGQQDVFGFFGRLIAETNGTFALESLAMFGGDGGGVFVDRVTAQRGTRTLDVRPVLHVRIEDGTIVEGWDHFHDEQTWDRFWN